MAGEKEHDLVAGRDRALEIGDLAAGLAAGQVLAEKDGEADVLQGGGDGLRIVDRLLKDREIRIGVVADHQRQALGARRACGGKGQCEKTEYGQ